MLEANDQDTTCKCSTKKKKKKKDLSAENLLILRETLGEEKKSHDLNPFKQI